MSAMLEIDSLHKSFGPKPALEGVTFSVMEGEIYGLLGHNGAGKSTTLGIILGMVAPDRGEVTIGGVSVQRERANALKRVGSIFESPSFYEYLSGWENLKILMSYSVRFDPDEARRVVEMVGLTERIQSKVRTYSHGMRQRLALAQALLPMPRVLLLDEPTDGLDPEGIKWFRDFVLKLRKSEGVTVLFNSHLLGEVEVMCDRVAILKAGRRVHEGRIADLAGEERIYEVDLDRLEVALPFLELQGCQVLSPGRISLPDSVDPAVMVAALVGLHVRVSAFAPVRRSLEDLYLEITR
ncbi:ABC-2 type transport system ATP-binding protein [Haloferula luteola]|uniref:ABC-2 type transport system ATP-binding protein n=1 Tax=Haloferula luteola TaxID=595692 RepID=A0A840V733_9BACT|nr:ABC transporter ATP-binding protein [Haloferula luteola]MBB5353493.1 ABC-2 type transport system ATP-binding protein [Haloferula luteola]